jgi:hypothetical protein
MVCPKSIPKLFPGDNLAIRLHGTIIIPPNTSSTMKLLGSKVSLTGVCTWNRKKSKHGFNGVKPNISIKGLLNLAE